MIANKILETKLINQYDKMYRIFAQANTLKLNLSEDNVINGIIQDVSGKNVNSTYKKEIFLMVLKRTLTIFVKVKVIKKSGVKNFICYNVHLILIYSLGIIVIF